MIKLINIIAVYDTNIRISLPATVKVYKRTPNVGKKDVMILIKSYIEIMNVTIANN